MFAVILAVAVVIADQILKYLVSANMSIGESFPLIPKILNVYYITNSGASFGILKDHRWIFMTVSSITIILISILFIYIIKTKKYPLLQIAIALLLGGAIGNMIDRVANGFVVDFLEFAFVNFAIFNLADTCITIGSAVLCIYIIIYKDVIFSGEHNKAAEEAEIDSGGTEEEG